MTLPTLPLHHFWDLWVSQEPLAAIAVLLSIVSGLFILLQKMNFLSLIVPTCVPGIFSAALSEALLCWLLDYSTSLPTSVYWILFLVYIYLFLYFLSSGSTDYIAWCLLSVHTAHHEMSLPQIYCTSNSLHRWEEHGHKSVHLHLNLHSSAP